MKVVGEWDFYIIKVLFWESFKKYGSEWNISKRKVHRNQSHGESSSFRPLNGSNTYSYKLI